MKRLFKKEVLNLGLIILLLMIMGAGLVPQKVISQHVAIVPCTDVESYGSGPFRDRICGAPGCTFNDYNTSSGTGQCFIVIKDDKPKQ